MINFLPTGRIIKDGWPDIRNKKMNWGQTSLRMTFEYEQGFINTSKGSKVEAYRFIESSFSIELFNRQNGVKINKPNSYFDQFKFDLSYNCFGYCFAESNVLITNPSLIIQDDYEEVDFSSCQFIIFKEHKGFGDNNDEIFIYSHAVKKLPNGNVSFKPGINQLVENVSKKLAIHNYNYNHEIYVRKKRPN